MTLPPLVSTEEVQRRLLLVFPEGTPGRGYLTRDIAASTVFTMLYVGAVESLKRFAAPKHVYRMSDEQAALTSDAERIDYAARMMKGGATARGKAWYADTTREPIRDETIRQGLIPAGAAFERTDLATTSSKPKYALRNDFAALFAPVDEKDLETAIAAWREAHLTPAARASIALALAAGSKNPDDFIVEFPNGLTRHLSPGESSVIAKSVIQDFAPRFLANPVVLWLSESRKKVLHGDDVLAKKIGLVIDAQRNLPDIILVDVGATALVVFVEVVSSDGPITELRRSELLKLTTAAGFGPNDVAFVTAFMSRDAAGLRKCFASLAWNSFAWLASEPEQLIALIGADAAGGRKLRELIHSQ